MQVDSKAIVEGTVVTDIVLNPAISVVFSQNFTNTIFVSSDKVTLNNGINNIDFSTTQEADVKTIIIRPSLPLVNATNYTLTIAKDLSVTITGKTYKLSSDGIFKFTTISANTTTYAVTFNLNYTPSSPITKTVIENTMATAPVPTPTRVGYTFVDWYENEELSGTPFSFITTQISADNTLYAKWEKIKYRITYTLYDGALPTGITSPQEVDSGTTVSNLPKPNKENVGFAGWFTDATKMAPYTGPVSADITLYAKWVNQYDITYELDGGELPTGITNPQKVNDGTLASVLPVPLKPDNVFSGWFTDDTKMTPYVGPVTGNLTLYAKFTARVSLKLILRGGTFSSQIVNPIVVNSGETPSLPTSTPTREHKVFKGWYDPKTKAIYSSAPLTKSQRLYAKWEREKFSLTYVINGGAFTTADQSKVQSKVQFNLKPKLLMPEKTNAYLLGWFKDSGLTQSYNGEKITADLTLYAKWSTSITQCQRINLQRQVTIS